MRVLRFASCTVLCSVALVMTVPVFAGCRDAVAGAAGGGRGGFSVKGVLFGVVSTSPRHA